MRSAATTPSIRRSEKGASLTDGQRVTILGSGKCCLPRGERENAVEVIVHRALT